MMQLCVLPGRRAKACMCSMNAFFQKKCTKEIASENPHQNIGYRKTNKNMAAENPEE